MNARTLVPFASALLLCLETRARADELLLTPLANLDISAAGLASIGDLTFEVGAAKLWVSDGSTAGLVRELSPTNGAVLSTINPSVIPGLGSGPDALAILTTVGSPDLVLFSPFGESEGGRVSQAGALVADYASSLNATGADVDANGNLWIASGTVIGGGSILRRINPSTGAILQSVPILGTTSRVVDLAFDPHTGACYCLFETTNQLVEVNLSTGAQITSTDLTPFLLGGITVAGGLDFDAQGDRLYVGTGQGASADTIVVLTREFDYLVCDGTGIFAACPCGNAGLPGRGCDNSFATGGGRLQASGLPIVSDDSYTLTVDGVPPVTSVLFFQGTTTPESNPFVVGDGLLCVSGAIIRLATKTTTTGSAVFPSGADPLLHVKGQIPAGGATRYYQAWYRNPVAFCTADTFNFTSAIRVVWAP